MELPTQRVVLSCSDATARLCRTAPYAQFDPTGIGVGDAPPSFWTTSVCMLTPAMLRPTSVTGSEPVLPPQAPPRSKLKTPRSARDRVIVFLPSKLLVMFRELSQKIDDADGP